MATSGSIDYGMTARDIITASLRKLNRTGAADAPDANEVDIAKGELNRILKSWMPHSNLWRLTETTVALVADTSSYSLSPVPYSVVSARYRDTNSRDTPMFRLTREEYFDLPDKAQSGTPTQFYADRQRATTTLYVWPVPSSVTTEVIAYTYLRAFEDVDDLDNEVDVRQEHLDMLVYYLAARYADNAGMVGSRVDRVIARAEAMFENALDADREPFVRFVPGSGW